MKCITRNILFICLVLASSFSATGQTITVLNEKDKTPIAVVHVVLTPIANGLKEQVLLTDNNGIVQLPAALKNQQCKVLVSILGYQKITATMLFNEDKTFYLQEQNQVLNQLVITGQFAPNSPEKSVHKIKIIDSKKIALMAAVNLRDVLSNELNIRIAQDNVLGSSMSLQGISGQNIKILKDGIPITGRLNGNIDISQINMNNVERIEIVEGPLSVSYGTDALAGTINIITKKIQSESFSIASNNYYESNGQFNNTGRLGYSKNKTNLSLTGGRNYFDGWNNTDNSFYFPKAKLADSSRYHSWKPKEQFFGTFNINHYFNNLNLGVTSDYFNEVLYNKGKPLLPYHETAFDDYYTTNRFNNSISLTGQINKKYHVNVLAAYNQYKRIKNTYYKDLTTLNEVLTQNSSDQDTSIFNNVLTRGSIGRTLDSAKFNYEIGYDINSETGLGLRIKNKEQHIGDYAIFASAEYRPFTKLTLRPGVRFIYNTVYKAPVIPSINLLYQLKKYKFRFSYARGFRAPSLKELYFYFVDINHNITGNAYLKAEQSDNFNLSILIDNKSNKVLQKIESSIFYNNIRNMISLAQKKGTSYSYFNIDKFQTMGIQLQTELAWQHFKFNIGASYVGRNNQLLQNQESLKFTYSPEGKCNLMFDWYKQNTTFAIFYKYTGKLPSFALDENNEVYKTTMGDYHTCDASVTKQFWKKKINVSVGAKNIFNVTNINGIADGSAHSTSSNSIALSMGRTYFIKLDINLNSKQ